MIFVNTGSSELTIDLNERHVVPPGGEIDVPDGYAMPQLYANGSRKPSTVEMLAPALLPKDPEDVALWKATPGTYVKPEPKAPTKASFMAEGVSEGVAEILAEKAEKKARKKAEKAEKVEQN